MGLACGFEGVYSLHGLCVCVDNLEQKVIQVRAGLGHGSSMGQRTGWGTVTHLSRAALMQGYPLVPLVDVVWVLAQKDAVEKQGPPADELLEAG